MDNTLPAITLFDYLHDSKEDILRYGKLLVGLSIGDIFDLYRDQITEDIPEKYYNTKKKGFEGDVVEQLYFGLDANSRQEADLKSAEVELKVTCVEERKDGSYKAGERLSITNIDYNGPIEPDFFKSHVWEKIHYILLVHYLRNHSIPKFEYEFKFVNLFTPPEEDLLIIRNDYAIINKYISSGRAHLLSESLTDYLGAATKGAKTAKSMRPQYYGDHSLARKRNFSLKIQYMEFILHHHIIKNAESERIVKNAKILKYHTFEEYTKELISSRLGSTDEDLCRELKIDYRPKDNKQTWAGIVLRLLGIIGNRAEEFEKAGIEVKTIKRNANGRIKESMSFPAFKFKELVNEEWEESEVYKFFAGTRFLLVEFVEHDGKYVLASVNYWGMPISDLEGPVKDAWERTVDTIRKGVVLTRKKNGSVSNNLPKISDHSILHVRPHADKAAYRFEDGTEIGNVEKDANELPDGRWMTTQCFWLNSEYLEEVLDSIKGTTTPKRRKSNKK